MISWAADPCWSGTMSPDVRHFLPTRDRPLSKPNGSRLTGIGGPWKPKKTLYLPYGKVCWSLSHISHGPWTPGYETLKNKIFLARSSKHVGIFSICHDSISCYGSCQPKMGVNLFFNLDYGPILLCYWILHWWSRKANERSLWIHWIFWNVLLQYLHWISTCLQLENDQSCDWTSKSTPL